MDSRATARVDVGNEAQLLCAQTAPPALVRPPSDSIGGTVILRATFQDYEVLLRHVDKVKVLQTFVQSQDGVTILDATGVPTFYAGHVVTQQHEALQVAEIFAGGFPGWPRAVSSLRDGGLPIHVSWLLERDPDCWASLSVLDSDLVTVSAPANIPSPSQHSGTIFLSTDFRDEWWRRVTHMRPVDLAVVSPPCQPWSSAGKSRGLMAEDGRLLLEVVSYLRVSGVPAVAFEEVDGFVHHKHFGIFYAAMRSAGFVCLWRSLLQLSEVLCASCRCFFLIFAIEEVSAQVDFKTRTWLHRGARRRKPDEQAGCFLA